MLRRVQPAAQPFNKNTNKTGGEGGHTVGSHCERARESALENAVTPHHPTWLSRGLPHRFTCSPDLDRCGMKLPAFRGAFATAALFMMIGCITPIVCVCVWGGGVVRSQRLLTPRCGGYGTRPEGPPPDCPPQAGGRSCGTRRKNVSITQYITQATMLGDLKLATHPSKAKGKGSRMRIVLTARLRARAGT